VLGSKLEEGVDLLVLIKRELCACVGQSYGHDNSLFEFSSCSDLRIGQIVIEN